MTDIGDALWDASVNLCMEMIYTRNLPIIPGGNPTWPGWSIRPPAVKKFPCLLSIVVRTRLLASRSNISSRPKVYAIYSHSTRSDSSAWGSRAWTHFWKTASCVIRCATWYLSQTIARCRSLSKVSWAGRLAAFWCWMRRIISRAQGSRSSGSRIVISEWKHWRGWSNSSHTLLVRRSSREETLNRQASTCKVTFPDSSIWIQRRSLFGPSKAHLCWSCSWGELVHWLAIGGWAVRVRGRARVIRGRPIAPARTDR